jgi:hypothetical protein
MKLLQACVLVLLFGVAPAHASGLPEWLEHAGLYASGTLAIYDVTATAQCLQAKTCQEANIFMPDSPFGQAVVKGAGTVVVLRAGHQLWKTGHKKKALAVFVGYASFNIWLGRRAQARIP